MYKIQVHDQTHLGFWELLITILTNELITFDLILEYVSEAYLYEVVHETVHGLLATSQALGQSNEPCPRPITAGITSSKPCLADPVCIKTDKDHTRGKSLKVSIYNRTTSRAYPGRHPII